MLPVVLDVPDNGRMEQRFLGQRDRGRQPEGREEPLAQRLVQVPPVTFSMIRPSSEQPESQ